jgi:hypothetical protein
VFKVRIFVTPLNHWFISCLNSLLCNICNIPCVLQSEQDTTFEQGLELLYTQYDELTNAQMFNNLLYYSCYNVPTCFDDTAPSSRGLCPVLGKLHKQMNAQFKFKGVHPFVRVRNIPYDISTVRTQLVCRLMLYQTLLHCYMFRPTKGP